ncbi:pantoate--beta-alanine ligase [Cochleicola gelatinilyticus]|uniref:Pantothenate synthetase n=1 Tax=Cochleicola gelatinilyticus TaxID=1763537 RepID=A0A167IV02_9FLAO|nr:pantoate--beta-alanine ligase [Cochleicola gelatinilyticus]OAB80042.1 pantoate--beta-alanine ligase [Cochleicola gelatinilyticus]
MTLYTDQNSLLKALLPYRNSKKIGFIPTMGALHEGHISLINKGLEENNVVVVSIFVNPTQFDNAGDLKKYPRTLEADIALISTLKGTVFIFSPDATDLYQGKVASKHFSFDGLEHEMEGKHRKGHFDGVGTVVSLLLKAVRPDKAYFGEKDFQQLQIVKKLVEIENLPTKIIGCPIVRESNGLAMSSRNKRLSPKQFEAAAIIHETLSEVNQKFKTHSIAQLNALVQQRFSKNNDLELEYFEIANVKTLKTAKHKRKGNNYRAFIAAFAGKVRLIDNKALEE